MASERITIILDLPDDQDVIWLPETLALPPFHSRLLLPALCEVAAKRRLPLWQVPHAKSQLTSSTVLTWASRQRFHG